MDGAIVQVYPDKIVYRASALGMCTKALVAARMGYEALPPPPGMQVVFDRGHEAEVQTKEKLWDEGISIWDEQGEITLDLTPKIKVVGHLDAKAVRFKLENGFRQTCGDPFIIEVKSMNQAAWDNFEKQGWDSPLWHKYQWQLSAYMLATGLPATVVRALWDAEAGEVTRLALEGVPAPFHGMPAIRALCLRVEAAATRADLPDSCDKRSYPCPYYYLHDDEVLEPLDDPRVDKLARKYDEARVDEQVAKRAKDDARKALKAGIVGNKVLTKAGTKVTFYVAKNRPSFDVKAMEKDGVEVEKYKTQTESERMKVTLPDSDE